MACGQGDIAVASFEESNLWKNKGKRLTILDCRFTNELSIVDLRMIQIYFLNHKSKIVNRKSLDLPAVNEILDDILHQDHSFHLMVLVYHRN